MKERGIKTISDLDNLKDKFDLIYSEEHSNIYQILEIL